MVLATLTDSGISVTDIQIRPISGRKFLVTWKLENPDSLENGILEIHLPPYSSGPYKTLSWGDPWEIEIDTITNKSTFFYEEIRFLGKDSDGEIVFDEKYLLSPRVYDPVSDAVRKDIHLALSKANGLLVVAFVRRKWGDKCPTCYHKETGKFDTQCPDCHGTGFLNGFHGPYSLWGSYQMPKVRSVQQGSPAFISPIGNRMIVEHYPPLSPGDVLMLPSSSRWFFVREVQSLKHKIDEVAQIVSLVGANKDSVIYTLPWRTEEVIKDMREETGNIGFQARIL